MSDLDYESIDPSALNDPGGASGGGAVDAPTPVISSGSNVSSQLNALGGGSTMGLNLAGGGVGALSGAAAGTTIGGPIGGAIGGAVGLAAGLLGGSSSQPAAGPSDSRAVTYISQTPVSIIGQTDVNGIIQSTGALLQTIGNSNNKVASQMVQIAPSVLGITPVAYDPQTENLSSAGGNLSPTYTATVESAGGGGSTVLLLGGAAVLLWLLLR